MHRDPRFWEAPDRFDPDRFPPARSEGRPRYAYFPFGGGARRCIADAFALRPSPGVFVTRTLRA